MTSLFDMVSHYATDVLIGLGVLLVIVLFLLCFDAPGSRR